MQHGGRPQTRHAVPPHLSRTCMASIACMSCCCCAGGSCPMASIEPVFMACAEEWRIEGGVFRAAAWPERGGLV